jgi:hypothetical protein
MIVFLFVLRGPGGVQSLIINLTRELIQSGEKVKIFHYKDDYIYNELISIIEKIEFYDLNSIPTREIHRYIDSDDCLIITMLNRYLFNHKISSRLLFWNVFPTSLATLNVYHHVNFKLLNKKLIKYLFNNGGVAFMDKAGYDDLRQKGYKIPDEVGYLQIPISEINTVNTYINKARKNEQFNLTYVGRAVDWKIHPFIKVLKDCNKLKPEVSNKLCFTIITDNIQVFKSAVDHERMSLSVKYMENLSLNDLNIYLNENSDLHFAMGTAAIDASKYGIPTVLVDASYRELPDYYRYRWIFESEKYCLGHIFRDGDPCSGNKTIEDILSIFDSYRERTEISRKCYSYTKENHDLKVVAKKLIDSCRSCKSTARGFANRNIRHYANYFKF